MEQPHEPDLQILLREYREAYQTSVVIGQQLDEVCQRFATHGTRRRVLLDARHSPPAMPSPPPRSESQRRMRSVLRRIRENEGSPPGRLGETPEHVMAPPPPQARRRAQPSERFQRLSEQRARHITRMDGAATDGLIQLQEASERLAQSNEDLRNLLERPTPEIRDPPPMDRHDNESERRPKRRRTDAWPPEPLLRKVEYGQYGQIKCGSLTMEVISSDAGNMGSSDGTSASWSHLRCNGTSNILLDNKSSYNVDSRRCNIVLQHTGERMFTINELVIEAPRGRIDEPLLEGLVFVAMRKDDTFDRTTQYQIHHYPTSRFGPKATKTSGATREIISQVTPMLRRIVNRTTSTSDHVPERLSNRPHNTDCDLYSDSSDISDADDHQSRTMSPTSASSDSEQDIPFHERLAEFQHGLMLLERVNRDHNRRRIRNESRSDMPPPTRTDVDNILAQHDFDEVLRRGHTATQDRRRRRAIIRSAQRQREEREGAGIQDRSRAQGGWTSDESEAESELHQNNDMPAADLPSSTDLLQDEASRVLAQGRAIISGASHIPSPDPEPDSNTVASAPAAYDETAEALSYHDIPSDFELIPPTAAFTHRQLSRRRAHSTTASAHTSANTRLGARTLLDLARTAAVSDAIKDDPPAADPASSTAPLHPQTNATTTRHGSTGNRISITFDPPVSGRYILLKLWKAGARGGVGSSARDASGNAVDEDVSTGAGARASVGNDPLDVMLDPGADAFGTQTTTDGHRVRSGDVCVERVRVEGWCGVRWFPVVEAA